MHAQVADVVSIAPVLMQLCLFCSDSVEREETLRDNSVQLQSFVQYEPDLFVSRCVRRHPLHDVASLSITFCLVLPFSDSNLNRYEVHPTRTVSEAIGPEFYTHLRVRRFNSRKKNH